MSSEPTRTEAVRTAALRGVPAAIADLGALVRIPSVSWPSFDPDAVARSADAVAGLLRGIGVFDDVSVSTAPIPGTDEPGMPAVLASRAARNGRPTVLLYAHHDVQPPGGDAEWATPPFEPTVRDGRLYGRGAADDKAGVMLHVGALRALRDAVPDFDLGVVVFIEGEEEYGSRSFGAFLDRHADVLGADAIVVADSGNWDATTPALTTSLRGNVRFTLRVRTLAHASHSGMFGGAVPDAMMATIVLLSTLWDADGAVAVPGLATLEADTPDYDEAQLRAEAGLLDGVAPVGGGGILSRIWHGPAVTITGIDAPTVAAASNTLAPEVAVVVSARVAPGQQAADAFAALERHLRAAAPFGAHLTFEDVDLGEAFLVDTTGWVVRKARRALAQGYGVDPIDIGVGGSIPFVADLAERFPSAQILVTGIEDPDTRAHSPNESLHLDTFRRALVSEAILLADLDRTASTGRTIGEDIPAAPRQIHEEKR